MALKKRKKPLLSFLIYRKINNKPRLAQRKHVKAYSPDQAVAYYFYKLKADDKNRGDISQYYAVQVKTRKKPETEEEEYDFLPVTCSNCGYSDPAGPGYNCPNCGEQT